MKIVMLDGHTINPGDLSWDALSEIGELDYTLSDCIHMKRRG